MNTKDYRKLYRRELEKLKVEIELYKDERNLWVIDKDIANSAGNLCLHLIGNLNHFIGYAIGKTGYVRNRDNEFSLKHIPLKDILADIESTMQIVDTTLQHITDEQLKEEYPLAKFEERETIAYVLSHLLIHVSYHLGQINYHRRLLDK